ncbi:MAG: hypothetical protein ACFFDP_04140, partial [Promethearchaeota archaeon]
EDLAIVALKALTPEQRVLLCSPISKGELGIIETMLCDLWKPIDEKYSEYWKGVETLSEREDIRVALETLRNFFKIKW